MPPYNGHSTRVVHAGEARLKPHHALTTPIYQTSTFTFTDTADLVDFMEVQSRDEETMRLEYGHDPPVVSFPRCLECCLDLSSYAPCPVIGGQYSVIGDQ